MSLTGLSILSVEAELVSLENKPKVFSTKFSEKKMKANCL